MNRGADVLLVDDSREALESLGGELRALGCEVRAAQDATAGWARFRERRPDLVISDIRMPGESGIDLLRRIRAVSDVPVLLLTARADVAVAVAALREGATDFLRFPDEAAELVKRAQELLPARPAREPADAAAELLPGEGEAAAALRARVRALAQLEVPVLIAGELGSGRLRAARALHALAGVDAPLVPIAAPDAPLPARGVPLWLELERWPAAAQRRWADALRAEAARFPRIVAIASPQLAASVERGEVLRELWLRLARFRVEVPPLRARLDELPQLARAALARAAAAHGRGALALTPGALDALRRCPWRGNFPELHAVLEQAACFATGARLGRDEIARAVDAVIAAREDSLAHRRAAKLSADRAQLVELLGACQGNVAEVARRLGMTRGAITYRLRKHGLAR